VRPTDASLLAGMAAGDSQAAATFVRRFQARVYGLALTVVGVAATAEEVAQDAFVRAWRNAGNYNPRRGEVATWLLTITRNAAVDALRRQRDQPVEPDVILAMLNRQPGTGNGPEDSVETGHMRDALRELPHEQAAAVVLARFYGLTAHEVAARQGVAVGTAKTRIRLGLTRLRGLLEVADG
jgi:RNA polymerase sigma-70 factor (ECF subfamily)